MGACSAQEYLGRGSVTVAEMGAKRFLLAAIFSLTLSAPASDPIAIRFAILGDRTGEVQAGVFEQVWKEIDAQHPDFVIGVGDMIQGLHDNTAETEWREVKQIMQPYKKYALYLAPGNHDVWSAASEELFRQQ